MTQVTITINETPDGMEYRIQGQGRGISANEAEAVEQFLAAVHAHLHRTHGARTIASGYIHKYPAEIGG